MIVEEGDNDQIRGMFGMQFCFYSCHHETVVCFFRHVFCLFVCFFVLVSGIQHGG